MGRRVYEKRLQLAARQRAMPARRPSCRHPARLQALNEKPGTAPPKSRLITFHFLRADPPDIFHSPVRLPMGREVLRHFPCRRAPAGGVAPLHHDPVAVTESICRPCENYRSLLLIVRSTLCRNTAPATHDLRRIARTHSGGNGTARSGYTVRGSGSELLTTGNFEEVLRSRAALESERLAACRT